MKQGIALLASLLIWPNFALSSETLYHIRAMYCENFNPEKSDTLGEFWIYGRADGSITPKITLSTQKATPVQFFFRYFQKRVLHEQKSSVRLTLYPDQHEIKWSITLSDPKIEIVKLHVGGFPHAYYRNPQGKVENFICRDANPGLPGGGMSGGN